MSAVTHWQHALIQICNKSCMEYQSLWSSEQRWVSRLPNNTNSFFSKLILKISYHSIVSHASHIKRKWRIICLPSSLILSWGRLRKDLCSLISARFFCMNASVFFTSSVSSRTKLLTSVNDQSCNQSYITVIGHVNIGIVFACIGISKSDWLFDTQSRLLQADWLILENTKIATLNINVPY